MVPGGSAWQCPSCGRLPTDATGSCPVCGVEPTQTLTEWATETTAAQEGSGPVPAAESRHGRFSPGQVLARRYRIVDCIGTGGMGEVYHADDLSLDQAVALKFLPEHVAGDPERLARLKQEVRIARQVSHPNVCRVYDFAEVEGHCFISMEYIRGEDLRSLLQRIGRLSPDKAAQVARQLADGLGAAHERGVLHRDLKPANVMLDERGQARIMDFGLAALSGTVMGRDILRGTPAYASPEQREAKGVSERSDLFSLGLVLYEVFTGQRALPKGEIEGPPAPPSSLASGLNPEVDRIILRCLERDPAARPASALEVRGAFPGADLLARAVARGETPARELVAGASDFTGLGRPVAWACLAGAVLALVAGIALGRGRLRLTGIVPLPKPPELLAAEARSTLEALGYAGPPRDVVHGFRRNVGYIDSLMSEPRAPGWWRPLERGEPSVIRFWYRESPAFLIPYRTTEFFANPDDPPLSAPGMLRLELDTLGRLRQLEVVPDSAFDEPALEPDWGPLLSRAGLDAAALTAVEPQWTPPSFADRQAAWVGSYPSAPEVSIRVEAASLRGRVVGLHIVEPWSAAAPRPRASFVRASDVVAESWTRVLHIAFHFSLLLGLGLLARRNLRSGRGDRRFAFRLAFVLFALVMAQWLLAAHHVPEPGELDLVLGALYRAFFVFGLGWLFYIALEPYARKLWPGALVSWVRLLEGRFGDAQLGRDVLLGCLVGAVYWSLHGVQLVSYGWLGLALPRPDAPPHPATLLALRGVRESVAELLSVAVNITTHVLFLFVALLILRFLLRRTWLAAAVHWSAYVLVFGPSFGFLWTAAWISLWHFLFFRFGWVSVLVATFVVDTLNGFPLTTNLSAWNAHPTMLVAAVFLALCVHGFRASLGGRPAVGDLLADN